MKCFKILTTLLVVMLTGSVNAQAGTEQKKAKVKPLMERVESGDQKAILDLGLLGDKSVIPYLQEIIAQASHKNFGGEASNAQMALAKLGEKKQLDEILSELYSDDPAIQDDAIKKLTYVGGKDSIRTLAKLLDDTKWRQMKGFDPNQRGPHGEIPQGRVLYPPRSLLAMKALAQIVPNPPASSTIEPTEEDLPKWREWWKDNNDK